MGKISVQNVGKAYKQYPNRWSRLAEWVLPFGEKRHQLKWILQDVNFEISPGESVAIVGVNGAGKSTLLKMITGTTQPTTGRIELSGRTSALLELGMGFHPEFTGVQNVLMAGQLLGIELHELHELLPSIQAFADIGDYIHQPVRVYSSGMQVRLAFAVATAIRPDILIVDEALSVGDAYFQAKCFQRINDYKAQGTTLLLVTHSPSDVVTHCERAIFLKNGRIALDASAREVSNRYLDELFGKKTAEVAQAEGATDLPTADQAIEILGDDHKDVFATRPGYLASEHRWGHGGASIVDYLIRSEGHTYPTRIESNAQVECIFKVHFQSDHAQVVAGLLIKTLEGVFLYGTNSFLASEGREVLRGVAGETRVFRFRLPAHLNEGQYLVSLGISSGDPRGELSCRPAGAI
jgi:lipopolysaccharide transport system ATP-binding protein